MSDPFGLPAIRNWSEVKDDIDTPAEALGAAIHRERHPSKRLYGMSCECWDRARTLIDWLESDTNYRVRTDLE